MGPPDHQRQEGPRRRIDLVVLIALADDDVAVRLLGLDVTGQPAGLWRGDPGEQDIVPTRRDLIGDMAEQLKKERVRNQLIRLVPERDSDTDRSRPTGPEPLGGLVDDVAVGGGDALDLGAVS